MFNRYDKKADKDLSVESKEVFEYKISLINDQILAIESKLNENVTNYKRGDIDQGEYIGRQDDLSQIKSLLEYDRKKLFKRLERTVRTLSRESLKRMHRVEWTRE